MPYQKNLIRLAAGLLCLAPGVLPAGTLTGRVVDKLSQPIAGVIVKQQAGAASTLTSALGSFSLDIAADGVLPGLTESSREIRLTGNTVRFLALRREPARIEIFSLSGRKLESVLNRDVEAGRYTLSISGSMRRIPAAGIAIARISVGKRTLSGRVMLSGGDRGEAGLIAAPLPENLAKAAASNDSLVFTKSGFATRTVGLPSTATRNLGDILLLAQESRGGAVVIYDPAIPTLKFAAGDVKEALSAAGYVVTETPLANLATVTQPVRIILTTLNSPEGKAFLGGSPPPALKEQGFSLRKDPASGYTAWWALGGDNVGAMYGGLEIAEAINVSNGLSSLAPAEQNPYIHYRGVKFNAPFDKRAFSYEDNQDIAQLTIKQVWDLDFWKAYFDAMARVRMNQMTVWNKVPWPAMVVTPGFEDVALNDVMMGDGSIYKPAGINTIGDKINHWKAVMQYASDRGIEFWMMSWNLYLQGTYGSHNFNNVTLARDYIYASNRQLVKTYPLLRGIGFAEQEAMASVADKETFLKTSYAQGIMDGLKDDPNPARPFGSYIRSDIGSSLDLALNSIAGFQERTSLGHEDKYSGAFMFTTTNPGANFGKGTANHGYWLTTRDDSYVMFRGGGDPEWMREYIKNMGDPSKLVSINIGANRTWGMDSASLTFANPHELVIQKRWWTALLYSRLGYDPTLGAQRLTGILGARFPEVDAASLYNAWTLVSRANIIAHSMRNSSADYGFYYEMCLQGSGWLAMADFNTTSQNENEITGIGGQAKAGAMPSATAIKTILEKADQALIILAEMPPAANPELKETLGDLTALALLARYYGHKLEATLADKNGDHAATLAGLQAASKAWSAYAAWTGLFYKPQHIERAGMSALGKAVNPTGLNDVKLIQLDVDNELNGAVGGGAKGPGISNLGDKTVSAGTATGALAFTVGASGTLVTAMSTNPSLVPPANIVLAGTGLSRTVNVTPAPGRRGTAVITISVSDGKSLSNASFALRVD